MEINYSLLKEKGNCRLKIKIICFEGEILIYMEPEYVCVSWSGVLVRLLLLCVEQAERRALFLWEQEIIRSKMSTTVQYGYSRVLHRWQHVFTSRKEKVV